MADKKRRAPSTTKRHNNPINITIPAFMSIYLNYFIN